jgi:hypothetical protein
MLRFRMDLGRTSSNVASNSTEYRANSVSGKAEGGRDIRSPDQWRSIPGLDLVSPMIREPLTPFWVRALSRLGRLSRRFFAHRYAAVAHLSQSPARCSGRPGLRNFFRPTGLTHRAQCPKGPGGSHE